MESHALAYATLSIVVTAAAAGGLGWYYGVTTVPLTPHVKLTVTSTSSSPDRVTIAYLDPNAGKSTITAETDSGGRAVFYVPANTQVTIWDSKGARTNYAIGQVDVGLTLEAARSINRIGAMPT